MAKLARLPRLDRTGGREPAEHRAPRLRTRFYAFLSYSHKDKELADWLHRELEKFRVPHSLAGKLTANGVVPRRLVPIFRDQQELSAGDDLAVEIEAALAASQFLIVLCSPTAATSRWTNLEIESFKRTRPEGCVLAAVAAGEPFASDIPGREHEECFPPALRYRYDRRGHRTAKRAEPLASDFREGGDGRRLAFLKLVAGMLGVGVDELVQRATTRRQRRLALLAAASLGGMAVTSTLAVTAIRARDAARDQRREAEGLISFMLGDLKDKLEPIGRLDALDGVGSRVLAYYQKEGTSDLSDAALTQRSRALSLMAEVANLRGDIGTSLRLYRAAMVGTAEAIRRDPDNPQLLFEHAQNVFYVGQIAQQQADLDTAETAMREYQRLALRMVSLAPDNMKWRMEENYADFNLGVVLFERRKFAEATHQFEQSSKTIDAIATADPTKLDYRASTAESLAWLSDSLDAEGRFAEAIQARQRDITLLGALFAQTHDNDYRHRLVHANRRLGDLYAEIGRTDLATEQFRNAVALGQQLVAIEPDNTRWLEYAATAQLDLAKYLLLAGASSEAADQVRGGCAIFTTLVQRHAPALPGWRWRSVSCSLLEGQLALAAGNTADAAKFAARAIAAAKGVHSGEPIADALQVAGIDREGGDILARAGQPMLAKQAWAAALAAYPRGVSETPATASEHAMILQRVGRDAEAQQIRQKLAGMGFNDPAFRANGGKGNV